MYRDYGENFILPRFVLAELDRAGEKVVVRVCFHSIDEGEALCAALREQVESLTAALGRERADEVKQRKLRQQDTVDREFAEKLRQDAQRRADEAIDREGR